MATLSQEEIKTLDQTRQRLLQLTNSLASLQQNIYQADPLPPWSSLQSLAAIISQNLASISQHLTNHHDLLASMSVYPLPAFPGKTQENLLGQLLRKKLEPNVEDWVEKGREIAMDAVQYGDTNGSAKATELKDLWSWAGMAANLLARKHPWAGDYTLEEQEGGIDNVFTGLRRKLKAGQYDSSEDSSDDEDAEDESAKDEAVDGDEMEVVGVRRKSGAAGLEFDLAKQREHKEPEAIGIALPMEDVFRFLMTGAEPKT